MNNIYESDFLTVKFDSEKSLLTQCWKAATDDFDETTFKKEMLSLMDLIVKYRPKLSLSDNTHFLYSIGPDLQFWCAENLLVCMNDCGLQRAATVLSADFVAQMSIEQATDETGRMNFPNHLFETIEEARLWILTEDEA